MPEERKFPLNAERLCRNPAEAVAYALKFGVFGRWELDEVEQFLNRSGPIFEEAMYKLGFRKHKTHSDRWARFKTQAEKDEARKKADEEWQRARELRVSVIQGER